MSNHCFSAMAMLALLMLTEYKMGKKNINLHDSSCVIHLFWEQWNKKMNDTLDRRLYCKNPENRGRVTVRRFYRKPFSGEGKLTLQITTRLWFLTTYLLHVH